MGDNNDLGAPPASQDRVTDAPHEAASASPPSGSVPTGAVRLGPWSFHYFMEPVGRHHDNFHLLYGPEGDEGASILEGSFTFPGTHSEALRVARLIAAAPELYEALEDDVRFFDSVANHEAFEATGIGNLCRGYAERRRDLLAKCQAVK